MLHEDIIAPPVAVIPPANNLHNSIMVSEDSKQGSEGGGAAAHGLAVPTADNSTADTKSTTKPSVLPTQPTVHHSITDSDTSVKDEASTQRYNAHESPFSPSQEPKGKKPEACIERF
uniref:Acyl-coenzyme A synthetase ACSM3, mitochondrial n=1 Tax=Lygus hesperus TaxID=30085 RepID=A0A0A9YCJ7_LYGHE